MHGIRDRVATPCIGLSLALLGVLVGCERIVGIPDVTLGSEPNGPCAADRPGPKMVLVEAPKGSFCIDTTEVTVADYNAYLIAGGEATETPAPCASAVPGPQVENDPAFQDHPVGSVSICHAWSYCSWAGKRLCGRLGDGSSVRDLPVDEMEWVYACKNGVRNTTYPYGETYDPARCNTESDARVAVRERAECRGSAPPFDRIYDMSGNQQEIVNDMGESPDDSIASHGGSRDNGAESACGDQHGFNGFIFNFETTGFRCCADPQ
jgi:formylglycine-generating enzyme